MLQQPWALLGERYAVGFAHAHSEPHTCARHSLSHPLAQTNQKVHYRVSCQSSAWKKLSRACMAAAVLQQAMHAASSWAHVWV